MTIWTPESSFHGTEPRRFCANYKKAGGSILLEYMAGNNGAHVPDLSRSGDMLDRMVAFIGEHVTV